MKGDLEDTFEKNGKKIVRKLNKTKVFQNKKWRITFIGIVLNAY